jgi:hypothetical protein
MNKAPATTNQKAALLRILMRSLCKLWMNVVIMIRVV